MGATKVSAIASDMVDVYAAIVIACVIFVLYFWFLSKSRIGLQFLAKGYGAVFRLVTIITCFIAGFVVGVCAVYIFIKQTLTASSPVWMWGFVAIPFTFLPYLLLLGVVKVLPKRNNRRLGRREFPFIFSKGAERLERSLVVSGYLMPIGIAAGVYFRKEEVEFTEILKALIHLPVIYIVLTVSIPRFFSYLRERASAPTIEAASAIDPRPPIMYLRAFDSEQAAFASGSEDEMMRYKKNILPFGYRVFVTFEQYFSDAFSDALGPLVALGNPHDELAPAGAVRDYVADSEWQACFGDLAQRSVAFAMHPGDTVSLQWEIGTLCSLRLMHKLFIITPPENEEKRPSQDSSTRFPFRTCPQNGQNSVRK